jgi:hypothetical protein
MEIAQIWSLDRFTHLDNSLTHVTQKKKKSNQKWLN